MKRLLAILLILLMALPANAQQMLKQSTAATIKLGPFLDETDGKTAETALTISQADIRLTKNGGDIAQTNNVAGATHDELGYYDVPLDTTDTGTLGRLRVIVSESGALPVWQDFMVVPANTFDTLVSGTDALNADVDEWLGTAAATPTVAGVPEIDVTHWNGTAIPGVDTAGYPKVTVKDGTGTGEIDTASGIAQADVRQLVGVAQSATDLKDFADAGYDPASNRVYGIDASGYNNVLEVGAGLTYTTIAGAEAVAVAGDLVVVHPGTYAEGAIGKNDVTFYFESGATVVPGTGSVFDGAVASSRILGHGKFVCNDTSGRLLAASAAGARWYIEADIIDTNGSANDVIETTATSGKVHVKVREVTNTVDTTMVLAVSFGYLRVDAEVISHSGALVESSGSAAVTVLNVGSATTTAADIVFTGATSGTIILNGGFESTHASANGINSKANTTIVCQRGSIKVPTGRSPITGSGTVLASNAFGYDVTSTTATGIAATIGALTIATDAITSAEIAGTGATEIADATTDGVWDESRASHTASGSFGQGVASVQGNVTGSAASVTDRTGYRLSSTGVDDIWDETQVGHVTAGTFGKYLDIASSTISTAGLTNDSIAEAVWNNDTADNVAAGTFGLVVGSFTVDLIAEGVWNNDTADNITAATFGPLVTSIQVNDFSAAAKALIETEVSDALVAKGLDHLVSAAVAGADVTDNSIMAKLVSKAATADWDTFVNTTDALEAQRDRTFAKGTDLTGLNDLSAAQVNTEADTALTDYGALKPTVALRTLDVTATGAAGVDWANVEAPTTVVGLTGTTVSTAQQVASVTGSVGSVAGGVTGSVGSISGVTFPAGFSTLTVANIQAGLATAANLTIVDDFVDDLETRLTATRAGYLDKLNLGADTIATAANLTIVDDFVDTEVAAILADTGNIKTRLPAALVSGAMDSSVSDITVAGATDLFTVVTNADYGSAAGGSVVGELVKHLDDEIAAAPSVVDANMVQVQDVNAPVLVGEPAKFDVSVGAYQTGMDPLRPTVAGRTLDVSTTGEAGIDWANVGSPTTAQALTGTTIATSQQITSVSGAVGSVTGAVGSVTGNVGGNVVGSVASVTGAVGSVGSGGITAASFASDAITAAKVAADVTTELQSGLSTSAALATVDSILDNVFTAFELDGGVYRLTTNALEQSPSVAGSSAQVLVDTTLATVSSQTEFTLTAGPNLDDALNGRSIVLYDVSNANAPSVRQVADYVGTTKTVTLDTAAGFALVAGDGAKVFVDGDTNLNTAALVDAIYDELAAGHVIAGSFGSLFQSGLADWSSLQRSQILAALSVEADIGVPSSLTWTIGRRDGRVGTGVVVVIDPNESNLEVAADFRKALGDNDTIQSITQIAIESGGAVLTSPAFADVGQAELFMASVVKFRLSGGTSGVTYRLRIKVLTVDGNTLSPNVYVRVQDD